MDLNELQQRISNFITVMGSWVLNVGKLYFSGTPENVTVDMIDTNGNLTTTTLPNVAQFRKTVWDDVGGALGHFDKTLYVNYESGDDNNDGLNSSTPFKTMYKALSAIPVGGYANIYLYGDLDHIVTNATINNKYVYVYGANSAGKLKTTCSTDVNGNATTGWVLHNSYVAFSNCIIETPDYVDNSVGDSYYQGFIKRGSSFAKVSLSSTTVLLGDTPFIRRSYNEGGVDVYMRHHKLDYGVKCQGTNKNALFYWNESGDFRISQNGFVLGTKNDDSTNLVWADLVSGISKDSNGAYMNIISNITI